MLYRKIIIIIGFFSLYVPVLSQAQSSVIIEKLNKYNDKFPDERLYLHFDKPYYAVGDTVWFKGYVVTATLAYSPLSSKVYVDLINDSDKVIKHFIFPATLGMTMGNIYLDEKVVHEGAYTIRAYTSWMRNFDADRFFYNHIYISGTDNPWLIGANSTLSANHIKIDLKYTSLEKKSAALHDMQVKLINDKKTLVHSNAQLSADGSLSLNFDLPGNLPVKHLTLITQDKNGTAAIPLHVLRAADLDLQFMPESGPVIETLPSHIGFKAIGEDGKGVNIKGEVFDNENNIQATFESFHNGMGVFDLVPQQGENYRAKITLPSGEVKTVSLPSIKSSGTELKVKNNPESDSLQVTIMATKDLVGHNKEYTIIGQSRGMICYGATLKFTKDYVNIRIPKDRFPTGVAHFILVNMQNEPVNERMVFVDHHDNLKVDINTGAKSFASRDSIPLHISVKDEKGNPVTGSFSLAVTDDGQVKDADIHNSNIFTQLLLSNDLKGYVEDPAYYFKGTNDAAKALDILLLTQGWIEYDWKNVINELARPIYAAEPGFMVRGRVSNLLNKPIANSNVTLISTGRYKVLKDTSTGTDGEFTFKNLPIVDTIAYVLQARKAKGRIINAGITIDENNSIPPVVLPNYPEFTPWYVNNDSTMLNYMKSITNFHGEVNDMKYGPGKHLLKAVEIKDKALIKNSQNLNGEGNSDQSIGQDEIEKAGKVSLLDLIEKKVTGFRVGYIHKSTDLNFMLKDKRVRFVIDGIDLDKFYDTISNIPNEHYYYQKETLDYLSAEDITGIEVIYSAQYSARYNNKNLTNDELLALNPAGPSGFDVAYLEITTRSGNGPFTKVATGIMVYKPAPLTRAAQFYTPRYPVKSVHPGFTDLRSTIHWVPNIITNKLGEATTSFYAADPSTTYTIILQGANLNGKVGYTTRKITIAK
ncbi:MAG: hypothetical protein JWR67_2745 [Mucilaginibacter sp.]|nr:hypothetical protein [Mucilaginibacter sp.]